MKYFKTQKFYAKMINPIIFLGFLSFFAIQANCLEISLLEPKDKLITIQDQITIKGVLTEPADILINGQLGLKEKESFAIDFNLNLGKNLILIEVFKDHDQISFERMILKLAQFSDLKNDHWAFKEITHLATAANLQTRKNQVFNPEEPIRTIDFLYWAKSLNRFSLLIKDNEQANQNISFYGILKYLAKFQHLELSKDQKAIDLFLRENFNFDQAKRLPELDQTVSRAFAAYLMYNYKFFQDKFIELLDWDTYYEPKNFIKQKLTLTEKEITPKELILNQRTSFKITVKYNLPSIIKAVYTDFSELGLKTSYLKKMFYDAKSNSFSIEGFITQDSKIGVVRLPILAKFINGDYLLDDLVLWVRDH